MRIALFFVTALYALAQEALPQFRLGTAGDRTEFRIGERIPITLDFTVTGRQTYQVSTDVRPRRLRPQLPDEFTAAPADGWADPLKTLRWTMDCCFPSAGSSGTANLDSTHPFHIERDLNEFIAFRKPGRYIVRATSTRVSGIQTPLVSNDLVLTIASRDERWTAQQFAPARAILETGKPPQEPESTIYQERELAQVNAVRSLRYLETEPASRYLASIYGRGRRTDEEIELALLASPFPEAAVDELDRGLADPDLTITQSYCVTLTEIKATLLERTLGHSPSPEDWKPLGDALDKRVFEAASAKNPQAKADTYYYLFEVGSGYLRGNPEVLGQLLPLLPSASPWVLYQLLSTDWDKISGIQAQLLPLLQQVVTRSRPRLQVNPNGLALRRLAELDRDAATSAARRDVLSGEARIPDPELLRIPLPASRDLDEALLDQYRQGKPVEARIARYASPEIREALWRVSVSRSGWNGQTQICVSPLFAYFFRVDPDVAAERLRDLRKAGGNACTALWFYDLESQLMSPGLEKQLILDARSANPALQLAAFRMLSGGGSPSALPALLDAIEGAAASKQEMISSVLSGRGWKLSAADYGRLAKACSQTASCPDIERLRLAGPAIGTKP
ncbi:MAG: hypothetical protein U0Q18_28405 [Bryobacteraceae bacterium]